jgi:hypothetical protein
MASRQQAQQAHRGTAVSTQQVADGMLAGLRRRYDAVDWFALEQTSRQIVIFACLWLGATTVLDQLGFPTQWRPL